MSHTQVFRIPWENNFKNRLRLENDGRVAVYLIDLSMIWMSLNEHDDQNFSTCGGGGGGADYNTECCSFPWNSPCTKGRVAKRKEKPAGSFLLYYGCRLWRINQGSEDQGSQGLTTRIGIRAEHGHQAGLPGILTSPLRCSSLLPHPMAGPPPCQSLLHFRWFWSHSSFIFPIYL